MQNILVIKLRYIGDVLLATPVLRALRDRFPDARITAAVNRGTEDILKWNPDLNEVLVVERGGLGTQGRFVRDLRRRRFDCIVDLTDGDRSAILAGLSGAPIRIGFNDEHRWRGLLYTSVATGRRDAVHRVEHDLEAVRALGIEPKPAPLVLRTSPQDEEEAAGILRDISDGASEGKGGRPLALLQPGARYWFKAWPVERFAALADRLTDVYGCRVLVGGDVRERDVAEAVRSKARSAPAVLAGRTTLLQYAAVLKRCALFVGNDNGPMHMAAALGMPVVALFGPSDPREWGPRGERTRVLYKGLDCRRCFHPTCTRGEDSCMKRITVDEVVEAAGQVMILKEPIRERV
ncbi:MAG: putative lipopolysaccharide heptosyltransferase III [Nitrospirae bacterium]|nr:MAG: putative lipopolysaccharide heptosyltransferase III [Nitrospirota bacterium]